MLSISPLTTLPCSPLEQVAAAQALGLDAIGLRLKPALVTDIDVLADPALMRLLERKVSASGLRVLDVDVIRIGPDTDVRALHDLLAFSGALGAENLVFTSLLPAEVHGWSEQDAAGKIAEVCEAASRFGVRPVVEFIPFRKIASLKDALRIAEKVAHPNFGICLDALHFFRSGGTIGELAQVPLQRIASVQLCDVPLAPPNDLPHESRFGRVAPGEGELPLVDLLRAFAPDMPISVEVPNPAWATWSPLERATAAVNAARGVIAAARYPA